MQDFIEVSLPLEYKTRNRLVSGIGVNDAWYITERKDTQGKRLICPFSRKWKLIGQFDNPCDAFLAYKLEKEKIIKAAANLYKAQLDSRAYEALIHYEVEITD